MLTKVRQTIDDYKMANKGESLLCCLSGGADSVALLICLKELGFDVKACHINHNLRGAESDRDEQFCRDLCGKLSVPLKVVGVDVISYANDKKLGTEQAARELRYRAFEEIDCDKICTAHTLSDSLETLLFNLSRGTGLKGLSSIPAVRGRIVRPLIECTRGEIEDFLRCRSQTWVTDSTNLENDYSRNKIRHNVIPELAKVNPAIEKTLRGTLRNLREDSAFIERLADEFYGEISVGGGLDCAKLCAAPESLSGRAIIRLCGENGIDCSRSTAVAIRRMCADGGKLTIGAGIYAQAKKGKLAIVRDQPKVPYTEITTLGEGEYEFFGKKVTLQIIKKSAGFRNVYNLSTYLAVDYDKIKDGIVIRNRRAGDRIKLAGKNFTSDLRKLMQSKLTVPERHTCLIFSDAEGVFAAENFGVAERVRVDGETKLILFCKISYDCHNNGI